MKDFTTRNQRLGKEYNFVRVVLIFLAAFIVGILLVDLFGFMMWVLSGQTPPTDIYAGIITNNLIQYVK